MLKEVLNMDGITVLNKPQLKVISGGLVDGGSIGDCYKCCYDNHPSNCSSCVEVGVPVCSTGSSAKMCGLEEACN